MKRIFFVRHAKSSWKDLSLSDYERPLNSRGKKDAPFMGKLMEQKSFLPDLIVSSSAKRAFSTAKKVARELRFDEIEIIRKKKLYLSDVSTILSIIHDLPEDASSVMIFIHNPGITEVVNYCSNSDIFNIPTTGVAGIDFEVDHWDEVDDNGKLFFYEYPKMYYNEFGEGPIIQS